MEFRITLASHPWRVRVNGVVAGIFLFALVVLGLVFAGTLPPSEAEARIRQHLESQVAQTCMGELQQHPLAKPDAAMAQRWERQLERTKELEFELVQVRRGLILPPWRRRAHFVARVVVLDGDRRSTRTFWLSQRGFIRECPAVAWYVPL